MKFWLGWMTALAVMLAAVVWAFSQWNLRYYTNYVGERLELLAELRREAMQEYLVTAQAELRFWSKNAAVVSAQQTLNEVWSTGGDDLASELQRLYISDNPNPAGFLLNLDDAGDGSDYSALHARTHPTARLFVTRRGYYDFFLIGPQGDIYYTVEKESDFATNLLTGPWRESGLAQVFVEARNGEAQGVLAISDMQRYGPSADAAAIFLATAIHDDDGAFIGVLALQLPTSRILGIMAYTEGMGESGETYLVGEDLLMRSDSRFSQDSTVLTTTVDTPGVRQALAGERGRDLFPDYRGVSVLSGYVPMQVGRHRWAVMAEMDETEVAQFAAQERPGLSGALLLLYGLGLWSVWYWRGRNMPADSVGLPDMELPDAGDGPAVS